MHDKTNDSNSYSIYIYCKKHCCEKACKKENKFKKCHNCSKQFSFRSYQILKHCIYVNFLKCHKCGNESCEDTLKKCDKCGKQFCYWLDDGYENGCFSGHHKKDNL